MPFVTPFTDESSVSHPNSYWALRFVSINLPNQTASLIYHGWDDAAAYSNLDAIVGERFYTISDPTVFEQYFGQGKIVATLSFYAVMDTYISVNDVLFDPDVATQYSYIPLDVTTPLDIGSLGPSRLIVVWRALINTTSSWTVGITIKINGTPVTITGTSHPLSTVVYYDFTEVAGPGDVVTFAYDGSGDLIDELSMPLAPIIELTATNSVGGHLIFSDLSNSGHIFLPFGV